VRRGARRGQRGAETLEFLGALPLLALLMLLAWQGVVIGRERAEAEADARAAARTAVLCPRQPAGPSLVDIDPAARSGDLRLVRSGAPDQGVVTATVTLPVQAVSSSVDPAAWGLGPVRASVTMRLEPCP
jgi:hypothetical protein